MGTAWAGDSFLSPATPREEKGFLSFLWQQWVLDCVLGAVRKFPSSLPRSRWFCFYSSLRGKVILPRSLEQSLFLSLTKSLRFCFVERVRTRDWALKKINLFLSALGLHCCLQAFFSCNEVGLLSSYGPQASHWDGFFCGAGSPEWLGSLAVAHGLSCPQACGIFLEQVSNLCPLHWQANS